MQSRRQIVGSLLLLPALATPFRQARGQPNYKIAAQLRVHARQRVIVDNDFSGDPDGLFQLAHQLLSPSADVRLVVGSHLGMGDAFDPTPTQSENAVVLARQLMSCLNLSSPPPVLAGKMGRFSFRSKSSTEIAASRIVAEAMREDTSIPLFYLAGAGLTDLAQAYSLEPRISKKLVLIWIGGPEHADLASAVPARSGIEYNTKIDLGAAMEIFNNSDMEIWQVPRDVYRTMLISYSELDIRLKSSGRLGQFLRDQIARIITLGENSPPPYDVGLGETYILGDSPLVTLTALQSSFEADSSSSSYVVIPTPSFTERGSYGPSIRRRKMRVYRSIDTRLTFEDMFMKFSAIEKD